MRRIKHAAITAAFLMTTTACGGELIHSSSATPISPLPAASEPPDDQCVTRIDVFDTGELLRPTQIMPAAGDHGAGQESWAYVISPKACGGNGGYTPPRCDNAFPWTGPTDDDVGAVLGPIGVTALAIATSRYDEPAASVTETILKLSGATDDILTQFAGVCGYVSLQSDIFAADLGKGSYQMIQIRLTSRSGSSSKARDSPRRNAGTSSPPRWPKYPRPDNTPCRPEERRCDARSRPEEPDATPDPDHRGHRRWLRPARRLRRGGCPHHRRGRWCSDRWPDH